MAFRFIKYLQGNFSSSSKSIRNNQIKQLISPSYQEEEAESFNTIN